MVGKLSVIPRLKMSISARIGDRDISANVRQPVEETAWAAVGLPVGPPAGEAVGDAVGTPVGIPVGIPVGEAVGDAVGKAFGDVVGLPVGPPVGEVDGAPLGPPSGLWDGEADATGLRSSSSASTFRHSLVTPLILTSSSVTDCCLCIRGSIQAASGLQENHLKSA